MTHPIDANEFLEIVRPGLASGNAQSLAAEVQGRWASRDITPLLFHRLPDVRRVAAVVLGLVGDLGDSFDLAKALWDNDEQVNEMAEHGLWSIWFRAGSPASCQAFREGFALVGVEAYDRALLFFHDAIRIDPDFAEAHNQAGICYYFMGDWEQSIRSSGRTLQLLPIHFGAMASMGHSYAQMNDLEKSLRFYRRSLRINPRMPALSRAIRRLESGLDVEREKEDSGEFLLEEILG